MGRIVGPGWSRNYDPSPNNRRPFFVTTIVRQYGARGVIALVVAAVLAFAPLLALVWFNFARLSSVVAAQCNQPVVVKPARFEEDQQEDEPGETALLQVICEVPTYNGSRDLLVDDDPARRAFDVSDSYFIRREAVYLRKAGDFNLPYGFLGSPPVSAWLPAGDYEILVVHDAPTVDLRSATDVNGFPLVTVYDSCSLPAKEKSVRRIRLPHYERGGGTPIQPVRPGGETGRMTADELGALADSIGQATAVPTPGGYLLSLGEPQVHHDQDHQACTASFHALQSVAREWTRDQLVTLRNWLPENANAARDKLSGLISALEWRVFFQGWYLYAAAGVAGLVFTRWGALAILEPHRRRESFGESVKDCAAIFLVAALLWFLWQVLTDGSGCHGPVPFRLR